MTLPDREIEPLPAILDAIGRPPGSKSLTNRALVCAALGEGESELSGMLFADDTEAMLGCLRSLGIGVREDREAGKVWVQGASGGVPDGPAALDANQSGTTARFIAPLLGLGYGSYRLTGHEQLQARPMAAVFDALTDLGVGVQYEGERGYLPVTLEAPGALEGGRIRLPGHVSSQFLSGLLLAAPMMRRGLLIEMISEPVSKPYIDMTETVMRAFGVAVGRQDGGLTYVVMPTRYRAMRYAIEPDASAASYFFAAAAVCGGQVRVNDIGRGSVQGDLRFLDVLARMGATVEIARKHIDVRVDGQLRGTTVDMKDFSDTAPTLAVVAPFASSPTRVTGIGFIRRKETDRVRAIVTELQRCGVDAQEEPDGFVINPSPAPLRGARIETYDDHRIAMSFAVFGLRVPGIVITNPGCVAKTFPTFFEALDRLRVGSKPR